MKQAHRTVYKNGAETPYWKKKMCYSLTHSLTHIWTPPTKWKKKGSLMEEGEQ